MSVTKPAWCWQVTRQFSVQREFFLKSAENSWFPFPWKQTSDLPTSGIVKLTNDLCDVESIRAICNSRKLTSYLQNISRLWGNSSLIRKHQADWATDQQPMLCRQVWFRGKSVDKPAWLWQDCWHFFSPVHIWQVARSAYIHSYCLGNLILFVI